MNIRKAGTGSNVNPFYGLISWFVLILKGCFGKSFPFLFYLPLCFILLSCIPSLWAFLCLQVFTMSFDCSYIIGHMTLVATYVNSPWPATAHTLLFFLYILIQRTTQGIVLWGCLGRYFSDTDFIANIGGQCWQTHDIVWPIACLKDMLTFSIFDIVPVKRASQTDWSSSNQCNGNGCLMKCQKTSGSVFNHFDPNEMWKRCLTSYFDISLGVHQHCISTSASLAGPYLVTGAMSKIKSVNTLVEVRKWENRA